jgi:hypothetical protein
MDSNSDKKMDSNSDKKMDSSLLLQKKEEAKLKRIAKKLAIKVAEEKKKNSVFKCRCADYLCYCHRFNDYFAKELCEDITKKLAEKFGNLLREKQL